MPARLHARPRRLNSAIAWLFMVGSLCFALGTLPAYAHAVGTLADASTYFLGSIFFTAASFLQLVQSQSPAMAPGPAGEVPAAVSLVAWLPRDRNWLAAVTQFPGTLAFNVSTLFAISTSLSAQQVERAVWRPDFVGSTLFLVSSALALAALAPAQPSRYPRVIAWVNMAGSVAFGFSAVGSFVLPSTGEFLNMHWADLGTLLGAICFLLGAALMLPAWRALSALAGPRR